MSNREKCIEFFKDNLLDYLNPELKDSHKCKILARIRKDRLQILYRRIIGSEPNPRWTKAFIVEKIHRELY